MMYLLIGYGLGIAVIMMQLALIVCWRNGKLRQFATYLGNLRYYRKKGYDWRESHWLARNSF